MESTQNDTAGLTLNDAEIKERDLMRKADHASDIGTFMSLASSALYFIERAIVGDKMPKPVNIISLTGVTAGMGAVIYAIALRHTAGKIACENDARIREQPSPQSWTEKKQAAPDANSRMQTYSR